MSQRLESYQNIGGPINLSNFEMVADHHHITYPSPLTILPINRRTLPDSIVPILPPPTNDSNLRCRVRRRRSTSRVEEEDPIPGCRAMHMEGGPANSDQTVVIFDATLDYVNTIPATIIVPKKHTLPTINASMLGTTTHHSMAPTSLTPSTPSVPSIIAIPLTSPPIDRGPLSKSRVPLLRPHPNDSASYGQCFTSLK